MNDIPHISHSSLLPGHSRCRVPARRSPSCPAAGGATPCGCRGPKIIPPRRPRGRRISAAGLSNLDPAGCRKELSIAVIIVI